MINFQKLLDSSKKLSGRSISSSLKDNAGSHSWITVVNPTNRRMLLQACDHCGVVKSENTVVRHCTADSSQHLISDSLGSELRVVA